jgi:hypothetical protein
METNIQDVLRDKKLNTTEKSEPVMVLKTTETPDRIWDEVDQVELTPEEVAKVIRAAKSRKLSHQKEMAYWENINKPVVFPTYNALQMGRYVTALIKQEMPRFVVDDDNRRVFKLLCQYCTGDKAFEETEDEYDLRKGIAIVGPFGCGKTSLVRGFRLNPHNPYTMISARDIAEEYVSYSQDKKSTGGRQVLKNYSHIREVSPREFWGHKYAGLCIDDIGTEKVVQHFGNVCNTIEEVILNRYDNRLIGKTHITTNLTADEIDELYGGRVRSRSREMFNWICFDPEAPDRRR